VTTLIVSCRLSDREARSGRASVIAAIAAAARRVAGPLAGGEGMNLLRGSVAGRCPILPSVVWTEGWGTSVPFSAFSPSVLRVNPQVFMPVERLQILGHRNTTKCPTLPAPKPRGHREGLGTLLS